MYWASGHVEWGVEDINPTYVWHENGTVECDGPTALLAPGILHKCPGIPQTKPHIRKISDMLLTKTEYIERKDLYICRLLLSELLLPIIRKNTKLFVSIDQRKRSQIIFCFWIRKFFDWIRQKSKLRNLQSWRCGSTKLLLVSNPNSLPMNTGCRRVTVCTVLI